MTSDLGLQSYIDQTHLADPVAPLIVNGLQFAAPGICHDDLTTYDVDFQHRFRVGARNRIVWGLGFRIHARRGQQCARRWRFFPPPWTTTCTAYLSQDEIALRPDLSLTLGSKLEHNDYTGFEFEPNARLSWILSSNQALWAAVSRAVRTPSRIDQDLSEAAPPHFVLLKGGSDFTSESVVAYELGYRDAAQLASYRLRCRAFTITTTMSAARASPRAPSCRFSSPTTWRAIPTGWNSAATTRCRMPGRCMPATLC